MTTNKELVRQLAEEMAKNDHPIMFQVFEMFGGLVEDNSGAMERAIQSVMPFAEIAVEFGAKMFEEGFREGVFHHASLGAPHMKFAFDNFLKEAKQERGLIAEKEGEDDKP